MLQHLHRLFALSSLAFVLGLAPGAAADDGTPEPAKTPVTFDLSVQERARVQFLSDKDFAGKAIGGWEIGNRARFGILGHFGEKVELFVQIQDVRTWGSEYNAATLGEGTMKDWAADGLDIHQAFGQINLPDKWTLRIGRQETGWHSKRLIGNPNWSHSNRSLDAVRIFHDAEPAGFEFLYATLLNRPVNADDTANRWKDAHMLALRGGPRVGKTLNLDGLVILSLDAGKELTLATFGAHGKGQAGIFRWKVEGYGQVGSAAAADYRAWMVGVRGGVELDGGPRPYLGLGIDVLSGDKDPADDTVRTFDTLLAANHGKYGNMDIYLNIPKHTRGEGLINPMLNTSFALCEKMTLKFDVHMFASAVPADGERAFHGLELDLNARWSPHEVVHVSPGAWVYLPGPFWGDDPTPEFVAYLMTDFHIK
jgi:hypothetical protein